MNKAAVLLIKALLISNISYTPLSRANIVEKLLEKPAAIFQYYFDSLASSKLWEGCCNFLLTIAKEVDSCESYKGLDWRKVSNNPNESLTLLSCIQLFSIATDRISMQEEQGYIPYSLAPNALSQSSSNPISTHFCACMTVNQTESGANWMAFRAPKIAQKTLNRIVLPGSHDAGAYELSNEFAPEEDGYNLVKQFESLGMETIMAFFIQPWLLTQNRTMYEQLNDGVRYVDLRVAYHLATNDFYIVHGYYGHKLSTVLRQIARFMRENPCEVIIINLKNLNYLGTPSEKKQNRYRLEHLIIGILDIQKDQRMGTSKEFVENFYRGRMLIATEDFENYMGTLQNMWERGKQVIFIYQENTDPRFFSPAAIIDYWANEDEPELLYKKLEKILTHPLRSKEFSQYFHVLQSQLTPKLLNIVLGTLFITYYRDLKEMADDIKDNYLDKWLNKWKYQNPNIIITDFIDEEIARKIYMLNK